jgi:hypothetical protein
VGARRGLLKEEGGGKGGMRTRALVSAWLLAAAGWQMGALAFLLGRPAGRSWRRTAAVRLRRGLMGWRAYIHRCMYGGVDTSDG